MTRPRVARFVTLLVVSLVAAIGVLVPAGPAAAAGCSGSGCTGKNPQVQGCSPSAYNLDEFSYVGIRFELRYSPVCGAAWTRVTSPSHTNTIFGQIRGGGHVYGVQAVDGQVWTKMISFQYFVKACRAAWFTGSAIECTAAH